ncbi:MAG: hypothetical protein ACRYGL_14170 [Janthinobacterium lividum]
MDFVLDFPGDLAGCTASEAAAPADVSSTTSGISRAHFCALAKSGRSRQDGASARRQSGTASLGIGSCYGSGRQREHVPGQLRLKLPGQMPDRRRQNARTDFFQVLELRVRLYFGFTF